MTRNKFWIIGLLLLICNYGFTKEKELSICLGNGFNNDTVSIYVTNDYVSFDTILMDSVIDPNVNRYFAAKVPYQYSSKSEFSRIFVVINGDTLGGFGFSNVKNNSILQIDFKRDVLNRHVEILERSIGLSKKQILMEITGKESYEPKIKHEYLVFSIFQKGMVYLDY